MDIRKLLIVTIFVTVIGISISYASLSQLIEVTSAGSVRQANWDVHFKNLSDATIEGDVVIISEPNLITDLTAFSGLDVRFNNITGSVTYFMDIVNDGDLDAIIQEIDYPTPTCISSDEYSAESAADIASVCGGLTYKLVYASNDVEVAVGDILPSKESARLELVFSFIDDTLPINEIEITGLNYNIKYVQNK